MESNVLSFYETPPGWSCVGSVTLTDLKSVKNSQTPEPGLWFHNVFPTHTVWAPPDDV